MTRTDPPMKLKRSVLRRVIASKLDGLRRGDFYVSKHLGPECYDPIIAEAKAFLDAMPSLPHPQDALQPPSPSLSEDFDTFVQIIAASILIDASMRGENAGESDPRFIKKKKKLLTKTLRGPKFHEFVTQIYRFDCIKRGVEVPPEEESEEESAPPSESESSDSDLENTSVTSTADGFSTSTNSKRHHGSSSSSARKRHKKEKKKLKKERKQKRREERRRRREEKRRKKEAKKKRKREEEGDAVEEDGEEVENEGDKGQTDEVEVEEEEESFYEIEHATKEEFEAFREDVLGKIPNKVKSRFREGGFSRWGKDWLPVLEIGPFDVEPGPVRNMWLEMLHNTRQNGREMTRLVFWYGVKYEDRGQAYSFVPSTKIISYEEGEKAGHCNMPKKIQAKLDKKVKLTKTEEQIERGLRELQEDMAKEKNDRIRWMMNFQEDYELAESMPDPEEPEPDEVDDSIDEDVVEVKVKRKPGRPKKSESKSAETDKPVKRKPGRPKKSESANGGAPVKRKPGRPKKSDAEKAKAKKTKDDAASNKKFEIIDEDDDYALESDDDDDKDYNEDSSDDNLNDSDDADDELSNACQRKRKASSDLKKPKKKCKSHLTEEEEKEERRRKAAEYREKKRREKAEALGLDYVPGRKKSKKKLFEEEQKRFTECEHIFLPYISDLETAKDAHNVKSVLNTINSIIKHVETLTPPFLRTYPLGMLVREVRKAFESTDPEVKEHCKRLTNEMKRVYNQKDKSTPDDFVPKRLSVSAKEALSKKSGGVKKSESINDVSMAEAVKTEDTTEKPATQSHTEATAAYPDQSQRATEIVTTDPVKTDPVKSEPIRPPKKTFSIKGMFEKPKPIPKSKVTPAVIVSGPVSPKPKSLPAWVTGPASKMDDFHEQHAKQRNLALEFLSDAASTIPSSKIDPMSISQSLELAIFAETKLRGHDWNRYWEKVHDVVAMMSPGKNQPNSIMLGIARGDYQDPSVLVTLSRREIHSLNQQRAKSLI